MGISLDIDMQTASGKNAQAISNILELRRKELGETSKDSCTALAINVLRSLRTDTLVAKPNSKPNFIIENLDSRYVPSFKRVGGKVYPILREAGTYNEINVKAVWVSKGAKAKTLHVFKVTDQIGADKSKSYIIVASNEGQASDYVKKIRRNRIQHRKGLAKLALGIAMNQVHNENVNDNVEAEVRNTANRNVKTSVQETGFDSGDIQIHIHDMLDYAALALKGGPADVEIQFQKALNKMTAYLIHRLHQKGIFDDSYKIPYPELQRSAQ